MRQTKLWLITFLLLCVGGGASAYTYTFPYDENFQHNVGVAGNTTVGGGFSVTGASSFGGITTGTTPTFGGNTHLQNLQVDGTCSGSGCGSGGAPTGYLSTVTKVSGAYWELPIVNQDGTAKIGAFVTYPGLAWGFYLGATTSATLGGGYSGMLCGPSIGSMNSLGWPCEIVYTGIGGSQSFYQKFGYDAGGTPYFSYSAAVTVPSINDSGPAIINGSSTFNGATNTFTGYIGGGMMRPGFGVATNSSTVMYITAKGSDQYGNAAIVVNIGGSWYAQAASQQLTYSGLTASTWYFLYASNLAGATTTSITFYLTTTAPATNGVLGAAPASYTYLSSVSGNALSHITPFVESGGYFTYRSYRSTDGVCRDNNIVSNVSISTSWSAFSVASYQPVSSSRVQLSYTIINGGSVVYSPDGQDVAPNGGGNGTIWLGSIAGNSSLSGYESNVGNTIYVAVYSGTASVYFGVCGYFDDLAYANGLR